MKKQCRNDQLITRIGIRLKQIRIEKGFSQEKVYFDTEIHIGRIETSKYNITVSTLYKLCEYYNVSLEDFFKDIE